MGRQGAARRVSGRPRLRSVGLLLLTRDDVGHEACRDGHGASCPDVGHGVCANRGRILPGLVCIVRTCGHHVGRVVVHLPLSVHSIVFGARQLTADFDGGACTVDNGELPAADGVLRHIQSEGGTVMWQCMDEGEKEEWAGRGQRGG